MGIDLVVLPNRYYKHPTLGDGFNRLGFWRESELFDRIRTLPSRKLETERDFVYYNDEGIDDCKVDAYDQPLCYVEARHFFGICSGNQWNKAVLIFLRSLPPEMPVVLYWY